MKKKYIVTTCLAIGIPLVAFYFLFKQSVDDKKEKNQSEVIRLEKPTIVITGLPERMLDNNKVQIFKNKKGGVAEGNIDSIYGGILKVKCVGGSVSKTVEFKISDLDDASKQKCFSWKRYELKFLPRLPYQIWQVKRYGEEEVKYTARLKAVSFDGVVLELLNNEYIYVKMVCINSEGREYIQKYAYKEEFYPMLTKGDRAKKIRSAGFHAFSWQPRLGHASRKKAVQYFVPDLQRLDVGEQVPLVIFLHGAGESGTDNIQQFVWTGAFLFTTPENQKVRPCFMLAPQHPKSDLWCSTSLKSPGRVCLHDTKNMILEMMHKYPQIDPNRIYITGLSSGGWGALEAVARWPDLFAAGVGTAESIPAHFFNRFNARPIWMFYNKERHALGVSRDAHIIQEQLGKHGVEVKITEYEKSNHQAWEAAYKTPGLHEWLFIQRKP